MRILQNRLWFVVALAASLPTPLGHAAAEIKHFQQLTSTVQGGHRAPAATTVTRARLALGQLHTPVCYHGRTWPHLVNGSRGEAVRTVQYLLREHGYTIVVDGRYAAQTKHKVMQFQRSRGLIVDGWVGRQTWEALVIPLSRNSTGPAVRAVQAQLRSRGYHVGLDGWFGAQTEGAVMRFKSGISSDFGRSGDVDADTWCYMVGGSSELDQAE